VNECRRLSCGELNKGGWVCAGRRGRRGGGGLPVYLEMKGGGMGQLGVNVLSDYLAPLLSFI